MELSKLREMTIKRQKEWAGDVELSLSYRSNELAGEVGELCNCIKKLERERMGMVGSRVSKESIAQEIADVIITADLLASALDIDLDKAVPDKFNYTSSKYGLKTKFEV